MIYVVKWIDSYGKVVDIESFGFQHHFDEVVEEDIMVLHGLEVKTNEEYGRHSLATIFISRNEALEYHFRNSPINLARQFKSNLFDKREAV